MAYDHADIEIVCESCNFHVPVHKKFELNMPEIVDDVMPIACRFFTGKWQKAVNHAVITGHSVMVGLY